MEDNPKRNTIIIGGVEFDLGKLYSNPYHTAFKSPEQIEHETNNNDNR